jgi:hypothetical protein
MANNDHVAQLMKGAAAWSWWRSENSGILPDLRWANLKWANLEVAELFEASG